jgi:hypothetical protein
MGKGAYQYFRGHTIDPDERDHRKFLKIEGERFYYSEGKNKECQYARNPNTELIKPLVMKMLLINTSP